MQELHCMLGRHTELLRIWHSNNTTTSISDLECYRKVGLEDLPLFSLDKMEFFSFHYTCGDF